MSRHCLSLHALTRDDVPLTTPSSFGVRLYSVYPDSRIGYQGVTVGVHYQLLGAMSESLECCGGPIASNPHPIDLDERLDKCKDTTPHSTPMLHSVL